MAGIETFYRTPRTRTRRKRRGKQRRRRRRSRRRITEMRVAREGRLVMKPEERRWLEATAMVPDRLEMLRSRRHGRW